MWGSDFVVKDLSRGSHVWTSKRHRMHFGDIVAWLSCHASSLQDFKGRHSQFRTSVRYALASTNDAPLLVSFASQQCLPVRHECILALQPAINFSASGVQKRVWLAEPGDCLRL